MFQEIKIKEFSIIKITRDFVMSDNKKNIDYLNYKICHKIAEECLKIYNIPNESFLFINDCYFLVFKNSSFKNNNVRRNWHIIVFIPIDTIEKSNLTSELAREVCKNKLEFIKDNMPELLIKTYITFFPFTMDKKNIVRLKRYKWNIKNMLVSARGKLELSKYELVINYDYELKLIKEDANDIITCVKAFTGQLEFNRHTYSNYKNLIDNFDSKNIIVSGPARTGKTVIAMRLLNRDKRFKLLLMNYDFYKCLINAFKALGVSFPRDRILHHDPKFDGNWLIVKDESEEQEFQYLIVDEAQRLGTFNGIDEVEKILKLKYRKCTIFFGDDSQSLNHKYDLGIKNIIEQLHTFNENYKIINFNESISIPTNVVKIINYLLGKTDDNCIEKLNDYNLEFYDNLNKFLSDYSEINNFKHIVCPTPYKYNYEIDIDSHSYVSLPYNYHRPYFNIPEIRDKYILNTYRIISRELAYIFLYIPSDINYNTKKNEITYHNYCLNKKFVINHLYTLMTRATLSLKIYCENKDLYNYFINRYKTINFIDSRGLHESF